MFFRFKPNLMTPIFKPYMSPRLSGELEHILYSGKLSFGEKGEAFEQKLKQYVGNANILTTSSYNHALLVVLSTLGLKPGDEVIASPVSCLASNQPFVVKGLKIIWADVDPAFGAMSVDDVKHKITKRTKAIFHNHYCGYLGHINEINALGKEHGIPVVDDAIEAFGTKYGNRVVGNLGTDITVFSFQTVRLPNTIEGGGIAFRDEAMFEKAKMIRDYGIDRSKFRDEQNEISKSCDVFLEGYGALMNEVNSHIGFRQMDDIDSLLNRQRENAKVWDSIIDSLKDIIPIPLLPNTLPNYWVYGTLAKNKSATIAEFRKKGFYASGIHINNNIYSVFKNRDDLKGVSEFMDHFMAVPSGWWVKKKDFELWTASFL